MLILLPPSEGKTAPQTGDPVDLEALAFAAELTESRRKLLAALAELAELPLERAVSVLAVSAGQADEVAVDAALSAAPAAPAASVYSGVLYERLQLPELPKRARGRVLIASALWGVLRPGDRIPYYRLSAKAKLDGVGGLAAFWRPALAAALPDEEGSLVVDMRSGAYAAAWRPKRATLLAVRAFSESKGKRKPISHMAKAVRGEVARALLGAKTPPKDPEAVAQLATAAGFTVQLVPGALDVIIPGRRAENSTIA
ncbi:MAG TPA: peroxide stress protein YaaA [Solirubrobacterales bacterium]|nr:peroxide stress protein YaaA [Solirubrobacterales bacterium]